MSNLKKYLKRIGFTSPEMQEKIITLVGNNTLIINDIFDDTLLKKHEYNEIKRLIREKKLEDLGI